MNFVISDDLVNKTNDIFNKIEKKLDIVLQKWFYESEFNYYFEAKAYKEDVLIKKDTMTIILYQIKILNMNVNNYYKYSLFFMLKKIKRLLFYYAQIWLEECGYKDFIEYNIVHEDFILTDSEPESEEEFNDDTDDRDQ